MKRTGLDTDVLVIGGAEMGSSAVWPPAERGIDVLLERFEPGHTRGASLGASRIFRLSSPDPAHIALAQEPLGLWRELTQASGTSLLTIVGGVDHGASPGWTNCTPGCGRPASPAEPDHREETRDDPDPDRRFGPGFAPAVRL